MSLQESDKEAAAVAVAPRVSLRDIEEQIADRFDIQEEALFTALGRESCLNGKDGSPPTMAVVNALRPLSICILVMKNGFTIIGKSAPASRENFNAELGRKFAYEDCIRQLWPLMGFNLRQRLHEGK